MLDYGPDAIILAGPTARTGGSRTSQARVFSVKKILSEKTPPRPWSRSEEICAGAAAARVFDRPQVELHPRQFPARSTRCNSDEASRTSKTRHPALQPLRIEGMASRLRDGSRCGYNYIQANLGRLRALRGGARRGARLGLSKKISQGFSFELHNHQATRLYLGEETALLDRSRQEGLALQPPFPRASGCTASDHDHTTRLRRVPGSSTRADAFLALAGRTTAHQVFS